MTAVPTNVQPPNNGLVLTDYPELTAKVGYAAGGASEVVSITWQLATNVGFTANLQSLTGATTFTSGQVAKVNVTTPLSVNAWYVRARATDGAGVLSAWSPVQLFNIDHRPFAYNLNPAQGGRVVYGTGTIRFGWEFGDGDPSDVQTAYQARAYSAANDALLFDTGKVISSAKFRDQVISAPNSNGFFYWQVKVWDFYDIESPWAEQTIFQLGTEPRAEIISPLSGELVTTPSPTVTWRFITGNAAPRTYADLTTDYATYAALEAANATYADLIASTVNQAAQVAYRVVFTQGLAVLHDSGWLAGSNSSYAPPALVHQGDTYGVVVSVRDAQSFEGSSDVRTFTGQWIAPDAPVDVQVDTSGVDTPGIGAVQITWNAEVSDPTFVVWRVYRRILGTAAWELVGTSVELSGRGEVLDHLFQSGTTYEYTVGQVAKRYFEEETESLLMPTVVTPESTKYWLIHGTDNAFNTMLGHVTGDSFTEEYETFTGKIIGRGRRMEIGTRYGYQGSLTVSVRDLDSRGSSVELAEYLAFRASRVDAFLRVPFGHIWQVGLGDIGVDRMEGTGRREFATVTIPYSEVA